MLNAIILLLGFIAPMVGTAGKPSLAKRQRVKPSSLTYRKAKPFTPFSASIASWSLIAFTITCFAGIFSYALSCQMILCLPDVKSICTKWAAEVPNCRIN